MVRPQSFGWNPETGPSNRFQVDTGEAPLAVAAAAASKLAMLSSSLRAAGVEVHVIEDRAQPRCPDAVFPNNWVSFHADGTIVLYPMLAPNRRLERRTHRLHQLVEQGGFEVTRLVDLTHHELDGRYLEGTGSVVFDHAARIAFACISPRTHRAVLDELCDEIGYRPSVFVANDRDGVPIYHTNVLLAVGRRVAVVCAEAIADDDRERVLGELATARDVLSIDFAQLHAFAGNMLELGGHGRALGARLVASGVRLIVGSAAFTTRAARRRVRYRSDPDHRAARRWLRALHARRGFPAARGAGGGRGRRTGESAMTDAGGSPHGTRDLGAALVGSWHLVRWEIAYPASGRRRHRSVTTRLASSSTQPTVTCRWCCDVASGLPIVVLALPSSASTTRHSASARTCITPDAGTSRATRSCTSSSTHCIRIWSVPGSDAGSSCVATSWSSAVTNASTRQAACARIA